MVSVELWPAATVLLHFAGPLRLGRTDKPADYCVLLSFVINYLPLSLARCHKAMLPVQPRPHHDTEMQERKKAGNEKGGRLCVERLWGESAWPL